MKIHIIAVGTRMPAWVSQAFTEYAKRMPAHCRLVLHEVVAARRGKGADIERLMKDEGAKMMASIPRGAQVLALERTGQSIDTEQLAQMLETQLASGQDWAFLIGGPEGLSRECLARAQGHLSLSQLTLVHPLVRVLLAEQLYRAWTIVNGQPYHR